MFLLGIWNECDDMGSFAWSPLGLKMKILPADNANGAELLAEIEAAGTIMRYEVGGKSYGAVRNFCQFQRPKKPNSTHPQTDEVRNWVNLDARSTRDGSEPVGNQLPTDGEKPRQMEDGGGNKDSSEANASGGKPPADPVKELFDLGVSVLTDCGETEKQARSMIGKWRKDHSDGEVLAALTDCRTKAISKPIEWLQARFAGQSGYVSKSGYVYRGSLQDVLRESERRHDMDTHWKVKADIAKARTAAPAKPQRSPRCGTVKSVGELAQAAAGGAR